MTFASLTWLWFVLAVACILVGMALTGKRVAALPPAKRAGKQTVRIHRAKSRQEIAVCSRCGQTLEPDARFCGACGLHVSSQPEMRQTRRSV